MNKFYAVIGNPPYQKEDGGAQVSAKPLYDAFINESEQIGDNILLVVPARWYTGGKGLDEFRTKMLDDIHIKELHDFPDPTDCFPNVNIRGGVCYILWSESYDNRENLVTVVTHEGQKTTSVQRALRYKDIDIFIRSAMSLSILDKVVHDDTQNIATHISPRRPFDLDGTFVNDKAFHKDKDGLTAPIICYGKQKAVGYVERDIIKAHTEWIDSWKVFMPYANNIGTELNDDNQNTFIGEPGSVCTETFIAVGMDLNLTKESVENISSYLRTKFARYLLSIAKNSQHGTSKTYRLVPMQDFTSKSDIDWSKTIPEIDQQLYNKYGLSDEEKEYIESHIKEME